jgi:hypothetical protein
MVLLYYPLMVVDVCKVDYYETSCLNSGTCILCVCHLSLTMTFFNFKFVNFRFINILTWLHGHMATRFLWPRAYLIQRGQPYYFVLLC